MKLEKECYIGDIKHNIDLDISCGEEINRDITFPVTIENIKMEEIEKIKQIKEKYKVKITLETVKPILDDKERKYLSGVIKPFRDRVEHIEKLGDKPMEFIFIKLIDDLPIQLPYFKKGTMYKGMKTNKEYTLEELGL